MRIMSSKKKTSKIGTAAAIIITVVVLIIVSVMISGGEKDPVVSTADNQIKIDAQYGIDIDYSDVESISLIEKSLNEIEPKAHRYNGYGGFGDTLKGYFDSDALGNFILFVKANSAPTILIERKANDNVYISLSDGEETRELYQTLIEAVPY